MKIFWGKGKLLAMSVFLVFVAFFAVGCGNKDNSGSISVAECQNGSIVYHENVSWMPNYNLNMSRRSFYEAVPDEGYYFERWVFLDKNLKELDSGYYGSMAGEENYWLKVNYFDSHEISKNGSATMDKSRVYLVALFTDDQSKLVNVAEPETIIIPVEESLGEVEYSTNALPQKKVRGTHLWKYIELKNKELSILEITHGVGESGLVSNAIHRQNTSNYYPKGTYAYFDYVYNSLFENRVEYVSLFVNKNN